MFGPLQRVIPYVLWVFGGCIVCRLRITKDEDDPVWESTVFVGLPSQPYIQLRRDHPTQSRSTIPIYRLLLEELHVFWRLVGLREPCTYPACAKHDLGNLCAHVCVSFGRLRLHQSEAHLVPYGRPIGGLIGGPQSITVPWWPRRYLSPIVPPWPWPPYEHYPYPIVLDTHASPLTSRVPILSPTLGPPPTHTHARWPYIVGNDHDCGI
jgi:hypothetical protein